MKTKQKTMKNIYETYSIVPIMNTLKAFVAYIKLA